MGNVTTIWKWKLETTDRQVLTMPRPAAPLTVQTQHGVPCLWCQLNPNGNEGRLEVLTFGTGHPIPPMPGESEYVGTYQLDGGALVFHVFARWMEPRSRRAVEGEHDG